MLSVVANIIHNCTFHDPVICIADGTCCYKRKSCFAKLSPLTEKYLHICQKYNSCSDQRHFHRQSRMFFKTTEDQPFVVKLPKKHSRNLRLLFPFFIIILFYILLHRLIDSKKSGKYTTGCKLSHYKTPLMC